jgi:uncharacterized protein DUF3618
MAQSPEELRQEIEQTRQEMSRDVEALSDKVSPGRIVQRRLGRAKSAVASVREQVMGSASSGTGTLGSKAGAARSSISDAVGSAPELATTRTQGNPLAAGLLAFAAGWLAAYLLPASKVEERAALSVEDKVKEPVKGELGRIADQVKGDLQGSAQDALQSVKDTASEATQAVADQGKGAVTAVRSEAQGTAAGAGSS